MYESKIHKVTGAQRQAAIEFIELLENSHAPHKQFLSLCCDNANKKALYTAFDSESPNFRKLLKSKLQQLTCRQNIRIDKGIEKVANHCSTRNTLTEQTKYKYSSRLRRQDHIEYAPYLLCFIEVFKIILLLFFVSAFFEQRRFSKYGCQNDVIFVHTEFIRQANEILMQKLIFYEKIGWLLSLRLGLDVNRSQVWQCDISYYYNYFMPVILAFYVAPFIGFFVTGLLSKRFRIFLSQPDPQRQKLKKQGGKLRLVQPPYSVLGQNQVIDRRYRNHYFY